MSHTTNISIEMNDKAAIIAASKRLGYKCLEGAHKLYSSTETGMGVWLPEWRYPIVIQDKKIAIDNYNGRWGNEAEVNKFRAYYGLEKAKAEARKKGYRIWEKMNGNEIELKIQISGRF